MEKHIINKNDLSLPFIIVIMTAALFLSGCNLNTETDDTSTSHEGAMAPTSVVVGGGTGSVDIEVTPTVSYQVGAMQPFDKEKLNAAIADGKTVFLDFFASWCPTCRANKPIVEAAVEANGEVVGFVANYDTDIELKKEYSVISQSSYVVLRDGKVLDRYVGALTPSKINELLGS